MHPPISEPDLVTILDEADAAAARLRRRVRLPRADLDDLRQDLLLDLIRRLPAFDARRGSIGAFAGIVLRNQASRIAARIRRERRATGGRLLSLDAPAGDGTTLADRLGEADSLSAWHGHCVALEAAIDAGIDLARALGALARARPLALRGRHAVPGPRPRRTWPRLARDPLPPPPRPALRARRAWRAGGVRRFASA